MNCKFCKNFDAELSEIVSRLTKEWETNQSNEYYIWEDESDENVALLEQPKDISTTDQKKAFQLYEKAANDGSVVAKHILGFRYYNGDGVPKNLLEAKRYYKLAFREGSWLASIGYAGTCRSLGEIDECFAILQEGIEENFLPAHYHYAWSRHSMAKETGISGEIRLHLETAANAGHPHAMFWLGKAMLRSKLGIANIPRGIRMSWRVIKMAGNKR